jgi:hypothetical protein
MTFLSPPDTRSITSINSLANCSGVMKSFGMAVILLLASSCFAQDIKRPTFEIDSGATVKCGFGTKQTSSGMANAYDAAGQSTSSAISVIGSVSSSLYRSRTFSAWQAASSGYSALTLNVNAQDVETNRTGSTGQAVIRYSIDNGATWVGLVSSSSNGFTRGTSTVSLSATQDLSQVKVAACVQSTAGGDTAGPFETLTVFDIWTAGTTTPQGSGTGATSGTPHRGMVIVN